jgi:hypothetical protein
MKLRAVITEPVNVVSQAGSSDRAEIGQADPTITANKVRASRRVGKALPDRPS